MLVVVALFMVERMTILVMRGMPLPYSGAVRCCEVSYGNVFWNLGLGPPTIPDLWTSKNAYSLQLPWVARAGLSYLSVVVAALALTVLAAAARERLRDVRANLMFALAAASVAVGTLTLPVSQQYVDRYSIDTAWAVVLLLPLVIRWDLRRVRVIGAIALAVFALFSILATQEYFLLNRARWSAWWELRDRGVALKQIDGGAEPYLYYEMSQAKTAQQRRKMAFGGGRRPYVLATAPMPGFRVIAHHRFTGWLGLHHAEIVTLEAISGTSD
jgi:hypothetical protein